MSPRVRSVEPSDVDAWGAMRGRLWPEGIPAELHQEAAAFFAGGPNVIVEAAFIAEDPDGRPTGFLEMSLRAFSDGCESMPVPYVEGWYVEPSARGRGVGRGLMSAAESWARQRGFAELASDTEVHNERSQRAHAALGFEEVERLVKFRKRLA